MNRFWQGFAWMLNQMKALGAICLAAMALLTCVDVVGRYFNRPVFGSVEIVGFLASLTVVLALPYTHQMKGHIGVEILSRLLSEKIRTIIDLCTGLLSFFLFGIVAWRMVLYAGTMRRSGEVSMNLELPEHVFIYITAFCFCMFALLILQDVIQHARRLNAMSGRHPQAPDS